MGKQGSKQEKNPFYAQDIDGTDLLIFPEMTLTGFTMKSKDMSETIQGDSYRFFSSIASEKSSNIFAGVIERRNNRNYNTLIHIKPDGHLLKLYRKVHPFSYSMKTNFTLVEANLRLQKSENGMWV